MNEKSTVILSNSPGYPFKKLSSVLTAQAIRSEAQNAIRQKNWSTILTNNFAKKATFQIVFEHVTNFVNTHSGIPRHKHE